MSVGSVSQEAQALSAIKSSTLERNPTNVMSVAKPSVSIQTLSFISESTQERNLMNVTSVAKPSVIAQISSCTSASTLERSPMNVMSVAKPSARAQTSRSTRESIQGRSPMNVANVEKLSTETHTLFCIGEFTPEKSPTSALSVARPSPGARPSHCTIESMPEREHQNTAQPLWMPLEHSWKVVCKAGVCHQAIPPPLLCQTYVSIEGKVIAPSNCLRSHTSGSLRVTSTLSCLQVVCRLAILKVLTRESWPCGYSCTQDKSTHRKPSTFLVMGIPLRFASQQPHHVVNESRLALWILYWS